MTAAVPGYENQRLDEATQEDYMATTAAVLGTGIMGAGMAKNLAKAGFDVVVWNRSHDKAAALADSVSRVAESPADAVSGADIVVTMLFNEDAVAQVMGEALPAMKDGAVWVQSATVGVDGVQRLAEQARAGGVDFVDAPVVGTRQPAEDGKLVVVAGCPSDLREAVSPVFDAVGAKTVWVGDQPGDGQRLKLVMNSWVLTIVGGTAQAISLARGLGIDPQLFLDSIAGGGTDSPYAQLKGKAMIAGEFPPAFPLDGAAKDAGLIADALRATGVSPELMDALRGRFEAGIAAGHGGEDMASVVEAFRQ
ncbi:3-hydroxyisobutyrate dehydrogenase [Sinomonas atrocyanea]|uniref:3-hydroxyisobutyrate dehydrogenase n=1 Tax=Sinomonas atrocyanea TaxID=37927 RepID=A0A127A2L2_9MICC|nr:NAD(P)-dependent oxidoreductase [Sinomonas atrocyanea]AMM31892.1 3-hydroxyisobutyrate dehydrogenase [Sinomonas atrocyanea]GEB65997.1 3-hydroxyisobutyrate dehydrogenase [Sinomonas atrocyanea]